jgi:hypothetical protein
MKRTTCLPWQWLETFGAHSAVRAEWAHAAGEHWRDAKLFLRATGAQAQSFRCINRFRCQCNHRVVIHSPDHIVACCECDGGCPKFALTPQDIALWELDLRRFTRLLAQAFECEATRQTLHVRGAWFIGTWSSDRVPVIFACPNEHTPLAEIVPAIYLQLRRRFILITPTYQFLPGRALELLNSVGAQCFDMAANVVVGAGGALYCTRRPGELFQAFAPEPKAGFSSDLVRQLFEVVKRFQGNNPYETAPLLTVFIHYCMEAKSAAEIARECDCSKSLVILRLKQLREVLQRDPAELRPYSSHTERAEEALSDSRARHIHRQSALDQPDDADEF